MIDYGLPTPAPATTASHNVVVSVFRAKVTGVFLYHLAGYF